MKRITDLSYKLDVQKVLSRLQTGNRQKHAQALAKLLDTAQETIKTGLLYKRCPVHIVGDRSVLIDGVSFKSRILQVNLEGADYAFPYLITCGKSYDIFFDSLDDMLERFYANEIGNALLAEVQSSFLAYLKQTYELDIVCKMNPGSLADWPLEEQGPLFALFGAEVVEEQIGVTLSEKMLMTPFKSLSGIAFPTNNHFENCQLCPQEACPGRKAPYDAAVEDSYL